MMLISFTSKLCLFSLFMIACESCRSTSNSLTDRWRNTGPNGWNNFETEEGRFSKVFVALGTGIKRLNNVEVVDLSEVNTTCRNLPNFPHLTYKSVGGLLSAHSKPVVCGVVASDGLDNICYTYLAGHHQWVRAEGVSVSRGILSGSTIYQGDEEKNGGLVLTGGLSAQTALNVDLLTYSNGQLSVLPLDPEMPVSSYGHCSVTLNSTTVLITGGYNEVTRELDSVHFYHVDRQEWVKGPKLNFARHRHACTLIRTFSALSSSAKSVVVVAGGVGELEENLKSVEYLTEGAEGWTLGSNLPTPIRDSTMITDQTGGAVIIGGTSPDSYFLGKLYQLSTPESEWKEMAQQLQIPRTGHLAFKIPDSLTDCRSQNVTLQQNQEQNRNTNRNRKKNQN